jgi:hypothetical protein
MRWMMLAVAGLAGCSGGKDGEEPGECEPMTAGSWTMDGSCLGMAMPAVLTLEEDGCSFTLGEWTMAMAVPSGGTVSGDQVTLTGDGWTECTGTLAGDAVEGTCPDGCGFTLDFTG